MQDGERVQLTIDLRQQCLGIDAQICGQVRIAQLINQPSAHRQIEIYPGCHPRPRKIFQLLVEIVSPSLGCTRWKHLKIMIQVTARESRDPIIGRGSARS